MYCSKCGIEVKDEDRFCHICGAPLKHDTKDDLVKKKHIPFVNRAITKFCKELGIAPTLILMYLLWLFLNISAFILSQKLERQLFWPISNRSIFDDYTYEEFFIFTLVPIFLMIIYSILKHSVFGENFRQHIINKRIRINKFSKRDYNAVFFGFFVILLNILSTLEVIDLSRILHFNIKSWHYVLLYVVVIIIGIYLLEEKNRSRWFYLLIFTLPPLALIILGMKKQIIFGLNYLDMTDNEKAVQNIYFAKSIDLMQFEQKLFYIDEALRYDPYDASFYEEKAKLYERRGKGDDRELVDP